MATVRRRWGAPDDRTTGWLRTPRDDLVLESPAAATTARDADADAANNADDVFVQGEGPFRRYERRLTAAPDGAIDDVTEYRVGLPWFGWVFAPLVRRTIARRAPGVEQHHGVQLWWAPPDRLDHRRLVVLGLLAAASLSAAFVNTLFTQTVNFAARDFGVGNSGQGVAGTIVRCAIVIVLPIVLLADRVGRRRMIQITAFAAPLCSALGALAPSFAVLTATQAVGRPLGLALDLLIAVVAAEEMPRNSRAYAVSVLAMASGLGAGVCVMALRLADLGPSAWRLVYVLSLVWLLVAADLARRLPETRRFEAHRDDTVRHRIHRRRLLALCGAAFFANLFIAPASFFQNRYLEEVRGYSGGGIALFTIATATPAGLGILVGGRLADLYGRRVLGSVCLVVGTFIYLCSFAVAGWQMWAAALIGGTIVGISVPALGVYRAELFPTGGRSLAGFFITVAALVSGSVAILITGPLLDRGVSHFEVLGVLALGQFAVAAIVLLAFPESAHRELEELNPEDRISAAT